MKYNQIQKGPKIYKTCKNLHVTTHDFHFQIECSGIFILRFSDEKVSESAHYSAGLLSAMLT